MQYLNNKFYFFCSIWLLLFALYLPAANAGFIGDFTGWFDLVRRDGLIDFMNRKGFGNEFSLYHFTQFNTYVLYKLLGAHTWSWHILFISLQAVNALLLFTFSKRLLEDSGVDKAALISACSTVLFCVSPLITEVIVWEPSFHFLQGFLIIFLILYWVQKYLHGPKTKYIWYISVLYFLSTHSLELFYLTPCFILATIIYYRYALAWDKKITGKAFYFLFIPVTILLIIYFIELRLLCGTWIAHIDSGARKEPFQNGLGKPIKYLIRTIFFERYYPANARNAIYDFCDSTRGMSLFYGLLLPVLVFFAFRIRKMSPMLKVTGFMLACFLIAIMITVPLWFENLFFTFGDRHAYMALPFVYMLLSLFLFSIPGRYTGISILTIFMLINMRYTFKANRYWMKSARIIQNLLQTFPKPTDKVTLLLDLPQNMQGVPMVCASVDGEFKLMLKLFVENKDYSKQKIYDVAAMNILTPTDGVHVMVLNDSTIRITANQWGTWWFYNGFGCTSYENEDYKTSFTDAHFYELTLKQDPKKYLLLFQNGGNWKSVDWDKKNEDQY